MNNIASSVHLLTCYDGVRHVQQSIYEYSVDSMDSTKLLFSQVRLIDAGFLWTEPHSKRIKIKVTIQKEVRRVWESDIKKWLRTWNRQSVLCELCVF